MEVIVNVITLLFLLLCNQCLCDICRTCVCSTSNAEPIIDCHDRYLKNNEILNFDLLTLDKNRSINKLILSKNDIVFLPINEFKNLKYLKKLDLSQNYLNNIPSDIFKNLNKLEDLDYSSNLLWNFDISILNTVSSLSKLNLSYNHISSLEKNSENATTKLKILDVSHNNLTDLNFLGGMLELEYLNLSFNKFMTIKENLLFNMQYLKYLHINNNQLISLNFQNFPVSLLELHAENNLINTIIFEKLSIHILNINNNNISDIHNNIILLKELKNFNISRNFLINFPNVSLENLEMLDISFNNLTIIPKTISTKNFPNLRNFYVNGNYLKDVKIWSNLNLEVFEVKFIETIEKIGEETFFMLKEKENNCINMTISNNIRLNTIQESVFQHMNICFLDLSNNHFTYLPPKLFNINVDNENVLNSKYLINIQGNPFNCNCSLQWMLNKLVPDLYIRNPSLLENLRCADPPLVANKRMIHWYKWTGEIFCDKYFSERMVVNAASISSEQIITFSTSPGMIAVLATAIVLLAILTIIGILLTRRILAKRRRINRRL